MRLTPPTSCAGPALSPDNARPPARRDRVAHVAGDADRVDALAHDHLTDHPTSVLVAWISANPYPTTPHERTSREPHHHSCISRTRASSRTFRPWWRWLLTALAFPPAGYLAHAIAGPIDAVPAALIGGVVTGAGVGAAQWALLRHRGVTPPSWVAATAVGLAAGLAVGASLVSYRTDISSLALMGAFSGLGVGLAQGVTFGSSKRMVPWAVATAVLWALGWTVTTPWASRSRSNGSCTGSSALFLVFLQSLVIGSFVPPRR